MNVCVDVNCMYVCDDELAELLAEVCILYLFVEERKCELYTCVYMLYPFMEEGEREWYTFVMFGTHS